MPPTTVRIRERHVRTATPSQVVDAYGREVLFVAVPPTYHGAGTGRRFAGLVNSSISGTAAVIGHAERLRNFSHDLVRNNPWAWNGKDSFVANAIGTGLKPQSLAPFREQAQLLWTDFTDESDSEGLTDFYGQQAQILGTVVESGECLVRLRVRRLEDGFAVPFQVQVLEPDHLPLHEHRTLPNGHRIRAGIEFDLLGRRVAYWMYRSHPGDSFFDGAADNTELVRVPAETVLHIFPVTKQRPGQIRGEPWLARTILRLKEIDEYDDAEIVRKKTAAMFAGFVMTPDDTGPGPLAAGDPDAYGIAQASWEPGTYVRLDPGEDVKFAEPADVGNNYQPFVNYQLRGIAAGMGVTFEQLTGDLSGVNYSSIRAGLLEFRRRLTAFVHQVMVFQLCRPIWHRFIRDALFVGALTAPGFTQNPRPWLRARWDMPGFPWVDPLKEIMAQKEAIMLGDTPLSEWISMRGEDPETIAALFALDQQRADRLGLVYSTDVRKQIRPQPAAA